MKRNYLLIAAAMSVGMMTSCSSSDTEETNVNSGTVPATVTLKFMTSNGLTRTSGAIPTSTTFGEGENAVSTCVVGVFDAAPAEGNSNDANTVTLVKKTDAIAKDKDGDNDQGKLEISTNTSAKYVYMAANINHDDVTTALSTRLANFKTITCILVLSPGIVGASRPNSDASNLRSLSCVSLAAEKSIPIDDRTVCACSLLSVIRVKNEFIESLSSGV